MSNIASEASPSTRARVWLESITLITRSVLILCSGIYAFGLLTGYDDLGQVCLAPAPVLSRWQVYRFLTSAIFHVGILHLVFNMMAFVPIGSSLERHLGSVQFLWLILLLCFLGDVAYITIAFLGQLTPISYAQAFWRQCAVGFSGVVFGLIVVDNHVSGAATRSIFGFFTVPAKAYPWALLVFWQLLVPQASFLGHLAGVLIGQLYVWGYLRWAMLSNATLQRAERSVLCSRCYHSTGFIAHTGGGSSEQLPISRAANRGGRSGWLRGVWMPYPPNLTPSLLQQQQQQPSSPQQPPQVQFTRGAVGAASASAAAPGAAPVGHSSRAAGPARPDPKAAAAAAAEARFARAAGAGKGAGTQLQQGPSSATDAGQLPKK